MDKIEVDGLDIGYARAGQGPPLVLLHGYVGDAVTSWSDQLDALSADFTVVAWDAPGAGRSDDPPETLGMDGYVRCLAGFLDGVGLERPHVAGLSFGGALALAFAAGHAESVRTLVLASAYAGWRGSLGAEVADQRLQQALDLSELSGDEFVDALLPTMFSAGTAPDVVEAFGAAMRTFHPAGFRAMARAAAEDLRHVLPRLAVPALLVYGDRDIRAPLSVAEDLANEIADAELVLLPGCGHACNIEAPTAFNDAVRRFLLDH